MTKQRQYTVDEVADERRVSRRTILRLIKAGRLPYSRVGRQIRISETDLQALHIQAGKIVSDPLKVARIAMRLLEAEKAGAHA